MRLAALAALLLLAPAPSDSTLWRFDTLAVHHARIEGHPTVTSKGIHFNGKDDALFFPENPLAGASTWTWEMVFRPDPDGAPEQRVFHLQPVDAQGADLPNTRQLFEIRIHDIPGTDVSGTTGKGWCLDSHARLSTTSGDLITLLDCTPAKLHPFGAFHTAAATYDGATLRSYIDGVLQGEGPVHLLPAPKGHASLGTRIDRRDYFKGIIYEARFTCHVLSPSEFLGHP